VRNVQAATAELVDIIERFYRLDLDQDCPMHVAAATLKLDQWGVKRVVSGRGLTPENAMRRCMFEAVERHIAVYSSSLEVTYSSSSDLASAAVDPRQLLQISDEQYAQRADWNTHVEVVHHIPQRFDETQTIGWVSAQSLSSESEKFMPVAYCSLGYPKARDEGFPIPDSSGLAAGSTFDDAAERGLLELIERDAVAIWWYNRLPMPALAFDTAALSFWKPFVEWTKRCGRRFWLLDLTSDLGVPVVAAVSCNEQGRDLSFGFGASNSPENAAESAMGEMVQFEATKKFHHLQERKLYPHFVTWCQTASINDYAFVVPTSPLRGILNARPLSIETMVDRLARKGLDAFAFAFPSASQDINVVRTIVPGLRSIWPRYAAGRLYEVPYDMGWVEDRKLEVELNPVPILY
jgi:oxazoline/thiazoline synthase